MTCKLAEVEEFISDNLGKRFTLKEGMFEGEEVTVVGYTYSDGLGDPAVIVELPETSLDKGWGLDQRDLEDHIIEDVEEDVRLWYVYIEELKEC